ncbi:hypothetical protein [Streptomyces olivoreticuli]|uniref:hypothetical protein n=1 Tax=Streptomyces olivoreticuli TaxID=68246 RepID=UPI0013C2DDFF|nr:hypothetical protein [Streptomyces olivoreticuli]
MPRFRGIADEGAAVVTVDEYAWPAVRVVRLRPCRFSQDFAAPDFFLPTVLAGDLATPAGDGREPFAEVAVAALTDDGHAGRTYELSGPRALSFAEALASFLDGIRRGEDDYVSTGVQEALGRAPRSFEEYARSTAPTGVWNP